MENVGLFFKNEPYINKYIYILAGKSNADIIRI